MKTEIVVTEIAVMVTYKQTKVVKGLETQKNRDLNVYSLIENRQGNYVLNCKPWYPKYAVQV